MRVYLVYSNSYAHLLRESGARVLVNYAAPAKDLHGRKIPKGFSSILIDSGVFQLQKGTLSEKELTVGGYSMWLQLEIPKHPEVDGYIAFDWDGGEGSTFERVRKIRKNYEYMRAQGLSPIPVWHPTRETIGDLRFYADQTDYIAIGGLVSAGKIMRTPMLLQTVRLEYPSVRFHVLGVGHPLANTIKNQYLPYSVDISTWNASARFGAHLVSNSDGLIREVREVRGRERDESLVGGKENEKLREMLLENIRVLRGMEESPPQDTDKPTGTQLLLDLGGL